MMKTDSPQEGVNARAVKEIFAAITGRYSVKGFPSPDRLRAMVEDAGFEAVQCRALTGGIAVIILGSKSS
jgi:ubiquinone/menaquinone biosynthesis C-methylase UbiE